MMAGEQQHRGVSRAEFYGALYVVFSMLLLIHVAPPHTSSDWVSIAIRVALLVALIGLQTACAIVAARERNRQVPGNPGASPPPSEGRGAPSAPTGDVGGA
jgi:hypothetical protein